MSSRRFAALLALAASGGCAHHTPPAPPAYRMIAVGTLAEQESHTTALLQAVSAVNDSVVWVSGHRATWVRTIDGGRTWVPGAMSGADSVLQFRDVHAVDANTAYLLAAGTGERSRIYKTTNAGRTWRLQFLNSDTAAFYDCFDFWDATHGIAVSDAVNGRLIVIRTEDGTHWQRLPDSALPPALSGEGAFASGGVCVVAGGRSQAWIGTTAPSGARVYHTADRGAHWSVVSTPVVSGRSAGIAALAFRDELHGVALGGRIGEPDDRSDSVVAITEDGGATWRLGSRPTFSGAVFGAAQVPGLDDYVVVVGPKGLDWSSDAGRSWSNVSANAYWSVGFASRLAGWAVGPGGRISRIAFGPPMVN